MPSISWSSRSLYIIISYCHSFQGILGWKICDFHSTSGVSIISSVYCQLFDQVHASSAAQ